jgi:hypothetical protein
VDVVPPSTTEYAVKLDAPVPPSATARSVMPVIDPPVMETLDADWVDIVPRPEISVFGIVAEAVMAAVPLPFT